jgi:hypothetical protein
VDQLSPPFRIAIVAMLAVCALWFTVLKPKDPAADAPLPTAPGTTGLANDVNAAKGAAATSDAANAKVQSATGGSATSSAATAKPAASAKKGAATAKPAASAKKATATAKPAAKPAATAKAATPKAKPAVATDPTKPLLSALDAKKAVVMLVYNRTGIDDRAVRRAVAATARHHGKVVVKAVPVGQVGRYEAITRGAEILQSPTVLVIAPDRKARAIVGFTTTAELDQAIADALAPAKK